MIPREIYDFQPYRSKLAELGGGSPAAAGRLRYVIDGLRGFYYDTGTGWTPLLANAYDVHAFGAVGDGVTDDTSAIQAALTAANLAGGGVAQLRANRTYLISSAPLLVPSNAGLVGAGWSSILKLGNNQNISIIRNSNWGTSTNARIYISNLKIDGNDANNTYQSNGADHTIYIRQSDYVDIDHVWIANSAHHACVITSGYGCYVQNCLVDLPNYSGIAMISDAAPANEMRYSWILNNLIISAGQAVHSPAGVGIIIDGGDQDYTHNIFCIGNHVYSPAGSGCSIQQGCQQITFSYNHVFNPGKWGVGLSMGQTVAGATNKYVTIQSNKIYTPAETGIEVTGANSDIDILDNQVINPTGYGIEILFLNWLSVDYAPATVKVGGNLIRGGQTHGVNVLGVAGTQVANVQFNGNLIHDNAAGATAEGVKLAEVSHALFTGNRIYGGHRYGISITSNTDYVTAVGNDVVGNVTAGINNASGTHHKIDDNNGYVNSNSGATSVANGGNITHGLVSTPSRVNVTGSVASEIISVTALGVSSFTVAIRKDDGTAGTTQTVYWEAVV